jgi:serine/alanine adding enzyme
MTLAVSSFDGPADAWDAFVCNQAGWTHCHLYGWKRVMETLLGHECIYLAARDDGALRGVLPLVRVRSAIFGHFLVSIPFLNYGGPLGTADAVRALVEHAAALADEGNVKLLELRSRIPLPLELPVSHRKVAVVLDLPGQAEQLWAGFDPALRSQVKRPEKEGVEVRFGPDQVDPFFAVFARHMRDLGMPAQPKTLFSGLAEAFGNTVWFGCAYHEGLPVAAGAGLRWGAELELTWASALSPYKPIAPGLLLYWSFMQRAIADRATLFNFGRSTPDAGPHLANHQVGRQWGSRDEPLWWYQRASRGAGVAVDMPGFDWGRPVWRRLPLTLATALGPRVVRLIP